MLRTTLVIFLATACLAAYVAAASGVDRDQLHHSKRQREVLLHSVSLDTREHPEFHETDAYHAYKQRSGEADDESTMHTYLVHLAKIGGGDAEARAIEAAVDGVHLSDYLPHNTFMMHASEEQAHAVRELTSLVSWVGAYLPEHRMPTPLTEPSLYAALSREYQHGVLSLRVAPPHAESLEHLAARWTAALAAEKPPLHVRFDTSGAAAGSYGAGVMSVRFTALDEHQQDKEDEEVAVVDQQELHRLASWLAHRPELVWVEPKPRFTSHNAYARGLVQGGQSGVAGEIYSAIGITGRGYGDNVPDDESLNFDVIALGDTGVNVASCYLSSERATPFDSYDESHRKVVSYNTALGDNEDGFGHGTFVAGQLVGETTGELAEYNGHALGAKLFVMDMNDGSAQLNVPDNVGNQLMQPPLDGGAKVQLYPWGSNAQFYGASSAQVDEFAHSNRKVLPIFSAGNDGDKQVDGTTTISAPSLAKNVVSVGCAQSSHDSFLDSRPDDEFEQRARFWHEQACGQDLSLYSDQRFCASLGQPTPCTNFREIFCDSFTGEASQCCGSLVYLNVRCCRPIVMGQIIEIPSLFNEFSLAWFASTGPTIDDRIKPDVVAPGRMVYSAAGNGECNFQVFEGSSYSAAVVAGAATLVRQYFMDGVHYEPLGDGQARQFEPSAALVKAALVNSGQPLRQQNGNDQQHILALSQTLPNNKVGFGVVRLDRVLRLPSSDFSLYVVDDVAFERLPTNGNGSQVDFGPYTKRYCIDVPADADYLKITVVWSDPRASESAGQQIVNNIDVVLVDSVGFEYRSNFGVTLDAINTVEQIHLKLPPAGQYSILVHPTRWIGSDPPTFSMVVTGQYSLADECHYTCPFGCGLSGFCHTVADAGEAIAGMCTCIPPFTGPDCTLTPCLEDANGQICSGNGYCDGDAGTCICNRFFRGTACERDNPTGVPEDQVVVVTEDDNDVPPGIVAGIAVGTFLFGLILGGGIGVFFTLRYLLARQKKRLAQFQAQLQSQSPGSGVDLLDDSDED